MRAIDISNYTSELTADKLREWRDAGDVGLVIIQAVDPPVGYPVGRTRAQIQACVDAGLAVDVYVWLWYDADEDDIRRKLALIEGLPIRQIWLDVEDTAARFYDQVACESKVRRALEPCDAFPTTSGERAGIYTSHWFWAASAYMNDTDVFADRELWDSDYDFIEDTEASWQPYGGWTHRAIKQYRGTSTFLGVDGVDLNVLSVDEAGEIVPPVEEPVVACDDYKAAMERAVNRMQIEFARKNAAGNYMSLRKGIFVEIQNELFNALAA